MNFVAFAKFAACTRFARWRRDRGEIFLCATLLASMVACHRAPELRPRLILQGEAVGHEFRLDAPYVLAVRITDAKLRGGREAIAPGGPKVLQLVEFSANVENEIKGNLGKKQISFFFFAKTDQNPTYFLDPGHRYIVSLREEAGILRSWTDATQLKIEVHSGSHNQKDLPLDAGPEAAIAYLLLTPGADYDRKVFAQTLNWPPYGDPETVNMLLKKLEENPDREIADYACYTTAEFFWHRPPCLKRCLESPDVHMRRSAARFLNTDSVHLLDDLQKDPSVLFPKACSDEITQMLAIYTEDVRPEVRQAACAALRGYSPPRAVSVCGAMSGGVKPRRSGPGSTAAR